MRWCTIESRNIRTVSIAPYVCSPSNFVYISASSTSPNDVYCRSVTVFDGHPMSPTGFNANLNATHLKVKLIT
jgi:hypothetical protein